MRGGGCITLNVLWPLVLSFFKVAHSRPLFIYFRLFNTADSKQVNKCSIQILPMTGSNQGPLVSEAIALPTEPQPLPPVLCFISCFFGFSCFACVTQINDHLLVWSNPVKLEVSGTVTNLVQAIILWAISGLYFDLFKQFYRIKNYRFQPDSNSEQEGSLTLDQHHDP